jgi:hypothetical protein
MDENVKDFLRKAVVLESQEKPIAAHEKLIDEFLEGSE